MEISLLTHGMGLGLQKGSGFGWDRDKCWVSEKKLNESKVNLRLMNEMKLVFFII